MAKSDSQQPLLTSTFLSLCHQIVYLFVNSFTTGISTVIVFLQMIILDLDLIIQLLKEFNCEIFDHI